MLHFNSFTSGPREYVADTRRGGGGGYVSNQSRSSNFRSCQFCDWLEFTCRILTEIYKIVNKSRTVKYSLQILCIFLRIKQYLKKYKPLVFNGLQFNGVLEN